VVIRQGDVRDIIQGIVHEFQTRQRWTLDSPIPDEDIATLAGWVNFPPPPHQNPQLLKQLILEWLEQDNGYDAWAWSLIREWIDEEVQR
jgi:hypothetical protein